MDSDLDISARIEALLFFKGEPVNVSFLSKTLEISEDDARAGIKILEEKLSGRGIVLIQNGPASADATAVKDEIMLSTAPQMGATIEKLIKDELNKDIGKAGLETLAIVLYRGPISRSEINYIRGVNSNYILRNLEVRGLIERVDKGSARSVVYHSTFELLLYMGISKVEDLPEYEEIQSAVDEIKAEPAPTEDLYEEKTGEVINGYEEDPDLITDEED